MADDGLFMKGNGIWGRRASKTGDRLIRLFAEAVVKPGGSAMIIDAENRMVGWVPITAAVESGRAFAVDVRREILAFDIDDRGLWRAAAQFVAELRRLGLAPVVVESGRLGHLHLFVAVEDPELRSQLERRARSLRLRGQRTMRPPLAPHRLDLPVRLVLPASERKALEALTPAHLYG